MPFVKLSRYFLLTHKRNKNGLEECADKVYRDGENLGLKQGLEVSLRIVRRVEVETSESK